VSDSQERLDGERRFEMGDGRLELTESLQRNTEIVMSVGIVRVKAHGALIMGDRPRNIPRGDEDVGKLKAGFAVPLIEPDRLFEMMAGALQIVDPAKARPEGDLVLDGQLRDIGRLSQEIARIVRRARCEPALVRTRRADCTAGRPARGDRPSRRSAVRPLPTPEGRMRCAGG
jgi:hypothetical protein